MRLFETMLVVDGRAVHLEEHFARMRRSAEALGFPALSLDAFRETLGSVTLTGEAVRCVYRDDGTLHAEPIAIPAATLERRQNARAITLDASIERTLPEHKLVEHYAVAREALQFALGNGANEALFVEDRHSCLSPPSSSPSDDGNQPEGHAGVPVLHEACLEGTATNVFAVRGTTLVTAGENILPGIVRAWTLARASELGLTIEFRAPCAEELREGAFLTGSLTMLAPLRALDAQPCRAPGDAFDELARLYREEIRRQNAPRD